MSDEMPEGRVLYIHDNNNELPPAPEITRVSLKVAEGDCAEYVRADLAAPQWQDIETAPRDGTDVLVYYECAGVEFSHVAFYDDGNLSPDSDADEDDIGWWSYVWSSVSRYKLERCNEPTHWMPMPEPPE